MLIHVLAMLTMTQGVTVGTPVESKPHPAVVAQSGDGVVLGTINAVDASEIESATLAKTKGNSSAVRAYASTVLKEHQASLTTGAKLAEALKVTRLLPSDSAAARAQKDLMATLNSLSGEAFDKAFMQAMLDAHTKMIPKLSDTLIPQAKRSSVRSFAKATLPKWKAHREAARKWLAANP